MASVCIDIYIARSISTWPIMRFHCGDCCFEWKNSIVCQGCSWGRWDNQGMCPGAMWKGERQQVSFPWPEYLNTGLGQQIEPMPWVRNGLDTSLLCALLFCPSNLMEFATKAWNVLHMYYYILNRQADRSFLCMMDICIEIPGKILENRVPKLIPLPINLC